MSLDMTCLNSTVPAAPPCSPVPCSGGKQQWLEKEKWKRVPEYSCQEGSSLAKQRWEEDWERRGVRTALTGQAPKEPIVAEFADKEAKYSVKIYHAPQFHILRHWLCGDDLNFARSIYKCKKIQPQGGKSRAAFFVSHDRRFLIKQVNKAELRMLTTQQEALMWYVDKVLFDKMPSVLAQVVGLFTITVESRTRARNNKKSYVVQQNLRFSLGNQRQDVFDLKGVNRKVASDAGATNMEQAAENSDPEEDEAESPQGAATQRSRPQEGATQHRKLVLWDANFREWTDGKPLCLASRDLKYLEAAVWNDTLLLSTQALVDYSLLLAAVVPDNDDISLQTRPPGTLSVGIIDYLRPYTWDKRVESNWKSLTKEGPDKPTVIEPSDYARRFQGAMGTFFVADTLC